MPVTAHRDVRNGNLLFLRDVRNWGNYGRDVRNKIHVTSNILYKKHQLDSHETGKHIPDIVELIHCILNQITYRRSI